MALLQANRQVSLLLDGPGELSTSHMHLWREAETHLRSVHTDMLNLAKLVLAVEAFVITILNLGSLSDHMQVALCIFGLCVALFSFGVVARFRYKYYVEMLIRKSIIAYALGFYEFKLKDEQIIFPFALPRNEVEFLLGIAPLNGVGTRDALKRKHWFGDVVGPILVLYLAIAALFVVMLVDVSQHEIPINDKAQAPIVAPHDGAQD